MFQTNLCWLSALRPAAAMYALSCLFAFFILPLAYFYFEEKDDDKPVSVGKVSLGTGSTNIPRSLDLTCSQTPQNTAYSVCCRA